MHFDYHINVWTAGGLLRIRSGKRGVGSGRRRRERERRERKGRQQWGMARAAARERDRRGDLEWRGRQERKWAAAVAETATAAKAAGAGVVARWWVRKRGAVMRQAAGAVGRSAATATKATTATAVAVAAAAAGATGAAPASLCRRAERVLHSQLRHGGRGLRLGAWGLCRERGRGKVACLQVLQPLACVAWEMQQNSAEITM